MCILLSALLLAGAQTVKAAERSNIQIQETSSFEEFSDAGSKLVSQYEPMMLKNRGRKNTIVSGRLIVKADAHFQADAYGAVQAVKSPDNIWLLQFENGRKAEKALARIAGRTGVEYAEPDEYVECEAMDGEMTTYTASWGTSAIGADKYAKYVAAVTSRKIKVAVIDSGVSRHSRLNKRLVKGYNFVSRNTNVSDPVGHGTHVAGTIVDCTPGLKVKIMPVRVVNSWGGGYTSIIGMGVRYAVKHKAKVINMSLGGMHSRYMDEQVARAVKKGVTVVVSSGNESQNISKVCPAHLKKAIVVGAVDPYGRRAYFSNYGKTLDVVAPGVGIVSTVPGGYKSESGTSMAAPHITAVAAMYKLVHPRKKPAAIEKLVKKHVKDLGSRGWDKYYGYGVPQLASLAVPVKIALNKKTLTMETGSQTALKVTFTPSTAAKKTIKWKSSDQSVAAVNSSGVVTGKKAGKAVITAATYNGKKAVCKVTVKKAASTKPAAEISVKVGLQSYVCQIGDPLVADFAINLNENIVKYNYQKVFCYSYYDEEQNGWRVLGVYDIDGSSYFDPWQGSAAKAAEVSVSGSQARIRLSVDTFGMKAGQRYFRVSIFPRKDFPTGSALYDGLFQVNLQS